MTATALGLLVVLALVAGGAWALTTVALYAILAWGMWEEWKRTKEN